MFGLFENNTADRNDREEKINKIEVVIGFFFGFLICFFSLGIVFLFWKEKIVYKEKWFDKQEEILSAIEKNYLYKWNFENISDEVCRRMIEALGDTYAAYYTRDDYFRILEQFEETETIEYMMLDKSECGYVHICSFSAKTAEELGKALDVLDKNGMSQLILDLRDNEGGLLKSAIEVLALFLPEGKIAAIEYAGGKREEIYVHNTGRKYCCVILVDKTTISAAELVAGVLKNEGYGCLMGKPTYGKGVAQRFIELNDGSAIRITYAKYFFPNGEGVPSGGIVPNIVIEQGDYIECAMDYLETADSYFSGDKSLEEAAAVIQSRASIYVGERKR